MKNFMVGVMSCLFLTTAIHADAQRPNIKFGDVKPGDFAAKLSQIDSNANAIVLSDIASSKYEGDNKGGFSIIFKRHTRIRIMNRNGFDVASISLPIYASGNLEEEIINLNASTFNLENGAVSETKLEKNAIYKDKYNKNYTIRKFTMPNLKENCIIDIKYTLKSPYERDLRSWQFQGEYPVHWSEYDITVPTVYEFVTFRQGYHPFAVNTAKTSEETYNILLPGTSASDRSETINFRSTIVNSVWAMENIPALKKENYTSTLKDHVSRVDFQLSKIRYPETPVKQVMSSWTTVAEEMMKDPLFGEGLTKNLGWLDDELKNAVAGATTDLEKAHKIYDFVRDNTTCTDHDAKYLSNPLRKVWQSKTGNVADVNLLLTAMLTRQGFEAHPVLLSTRENGKAYEAYPIMDRLNYVVCQVKVNDAPYLLDASHNKLGFGKLPSDCYNGYARIIDVLPALIDLKADSLDEAKVTSVIVVNDEQSGMTGSYSSILGDNESYNLRETMVKTTKEDYFKKVKSSFGMDVELTGSEIEALKTYDEPIKVKYDFKMDFSEDLIYLNPVFSEGYKDNPFKAAERSYPVEMPFKINETFVLRMDIPKGYKVEELPKSTRVKLNDNEGMFEYLVSGIDGVLQLRSVVKLNRATFLPEDYQSLRDFFAYVVKKHGEQIVLKKIKS
ncbi:transglutaminase domain-containing protein [Segetibacter sp. 3557_3]|uniref:transglutaminase domain-containing protein n=1 Tax=Segetibacter sp. 3557_3 TaxID=2547429 RepID=UPI0014050A71|nr:transglutaminase domain-containing protein [Segetibacter sp. 3557_3]